MNQDEFKAQIKMLMRDRVALGMNDDRYQGAEHEPQLWVALDGAEPEPIGERGMLMWSVISPAKVVDLIASLLEKALFDVPPDKRYHGAILISEAWQRVAPADDEEVAKRIRKLSRERNLGHDPESFSVVIGAGYSPKTDEFVFLTTTDGEAVLDMSDDPTEGGIPDAMRKLGHALMGAERAV